MAVGEGIESEVHDVPDHLIQPYFFQVQDRFFGKLQKLLDKSFHPAGFGLDNFQNVFTARTERFPFQAGQGQLRVV